MEALFSPETRDVLTTHLAKLAVQSKTAAPPWALGGALGGAALGGLHGYLADRGNEEGERHPWGSALSGAMSGAALGGGAGLLAQAGPHWKEMMQSHQAPLPETEAIQKLTHPNPTRMQGLGAAAAGLGAAGLRAGQGVGEAVSGIARRPFRHPVGLLGAGDLMQKMVGTAGGIAGKQIGRPGTDPATFRAGVDKQYPSAGGKSDGKPSSSNVRDHLHRLRYSTNNDAAIRQALLRARLGQSTGDLRARDISDAYYAGAGTTGRSGNMAAINDVLSGFGIKTDPLMGTGYHLPTHAPQHQQRVQNIQNVASDLDRRRLLAQMTGDTRTAIPTKVTGVGSYNPRTRAPWTTADLNDAGRGPLHDYLSNVERGRPRIAPRPGIRGTLERASEGSLGAGGRALMYGAPVVAEGLLRNYLAQRASNAILQGASRMGGKLLGR